MFPILFRYASYLLKTNTSRSREAIRWADYALDNKQNWSGREYEANVFSLYEIKSKAAYRLWVNAEQKWTAYRTENHLIAANKYRGTAKNYAREWLDYARAAGKDTAEAKAICESVGDVDFCK